MKSSSIFYNKIKQELAELGIYIDDKDIFILVKIILSCLFDTLKETTSNVFIDGKSIVASFYRGGIKVVFNKNHKNDKKFIGMCDTTNRLIFEKMFSNVLENLDSSTED